MSEYCKHGLEMNQTCRKCGRIKKVDVPNFSARAQAFTSSIDRLEETVRKMKTELAANPGAAPAGPPDTARDRQAPPPAQDGSPDKPYPWQRR